MNRRSWLAGVGAGLGSIWLGGCDAIANSSAVRKTIRSAEGLNQAAQRLIIGRRALAPEYDKADISPDFRANGTTNPSDGAYQTSAAGGFADWRLVVDGLVERPMALTLDQVRALPARTQITRHDCVEGWSSIGEWTGARLGPLLERAGLKPNARYVVFHCADALGQGAGRSLYYESIDLTDAFHEQTILAYLMNGQALPVQHGAPLRLRVERQLGYKHAKYVRRIEAVESFADIHYGKGGYWEDRGYEWYAGI